MLRLAIFILPLIIIPDTLQHFTAKAKLIKEYHEIPSGSGIELIEGTLYMIGDDSPELFELDGSTFKIKKRHHFIAEHQPGRIAKAVKPDFEAMASCILDGKNSLLIFGSGGIPNNRDKLVIVTLKMKEPTFRIFSLKTFYTEIISKLKIRQDQLNIEAAVIHNDRVLLFNRGISFIVSIGLKDLLRSAAENKAPSFTIINCKFDNNDKGHIGFSGATMKGNDGTILLTATTEETSNYIADGKVGGSYISVLRISELSDGMVIPLIEIKGPDGKHLAQKIESICVRSQNASRDELLAVTDNDDGTTNLFAIELMSR